MPICNPLSADFAIMFVDLRASTPVVCHVLWHTPNKSLFMTIFPLRCIFATISSCIMDLQAKTVEFLRLPPEIRTQIYHHVLSEPQGLSLNSLQRPVLLATSRQIQQEASPILFASNHFGFNLSRSHPGCDPNIILRPSTGMFLRNMQAYMTHIVRINVHATIHFTFWTRFFTTFRIEVKRGRVHIKLDVTDSRRYARSLCPSCEHCTNRSVEKLNLANAKRSVSMISRHWSTYFDGIYLTGRMLALLHDVKHDKKDCLLRSPTILRPQSQRRAQQHRLIVKCFRTRYYLDLQGGE